MGLILCCLLGSFLSLVRILWYFRTELFVCDGGVLAEV
jgi:hypothetical protein